MNITQLTPEKAQAAFKILAAVAETIRKVGSVPSGYLYARLMSHTDLDTYTAIIGHLKGAGLVEEKNFLLTWIGPKKGS